MVRKTIVALAFLSIVVLLIAGCDLFPPQNTLRLSGPPSITDIGGGVLEISFRLYNSGSESLRNCKVKWYVDDTVNGSIDFDEVTGWAPALGVNLSVGETSSLITVQTAAGSVSLPVEYYGIYAWGWDNPADN